MLASLILLVQHNALGQNITQELPDHSSSDYSNAQGQPTYPLDSNTALDTIPSNDNLGIVLPGGYIERMDNYLIGQISFVNDNERFSVDQGTQEYQIYPNGLSKLKFHLNYRFLSLGFNVIPKFISSNDDDRLKGKTHGIGFSTSLNFANWVQSFSYSNIHGFYLDNTKDFQPDWQEGDPYVQFPDLVYRNYQGMTGYSFNPNFSTKALLTGTERQLKSAGTFLPSLLYRYYTVDNRAEVTASSSTQKSNNFEILASAGYYYTYVIKEDFYLSAGGSAGYGLLSAKITTRRIADRIVTKQNNGIFRYDLRAAAGYNSERIFAGFVFTTENSQYKQANTSVINANWRVITQFSLAYRFNAPAQLRDNLNRIIPGG